MRNILLYVCSLVLIHGMYGCSSYKEGEHNIDHVILAINNLDSGIIEIKRLTGIEPVYGGKHPDSYTQNALLSVGDNMYIEILAPRNDLDSIPVFFKNLNHLTPVGWAMFSNDIEKTKNSIESIGFKLGDIIPGSRITAKGEKLEWKTGVITETNQETLFPFFISWNPNSIHPSQNAPLGCTLKRLVLKSSKLDNLEKLLEGLNVSNHKIKVEPGNADQIDLVLETSKGEVRITSSTN